MLIARLSDMCVKPYETLVRFGHAELGMASILFWWCTHWGGGFKISGQAKLQPLGRCRPAAEMDASTGRGACLRNRLRQKCNGDNLGICMWQSTECRMEEQPAHAGIGTVYCTNAPEALSLFVAQTDQQSAFLFVRISRRQATASLCSDAD
ncbi:hypothetical protein K431DRAFT_15987 [Polychaeton citri CBS 116435]|uniref:Uncharacterized protein n=1 Tax=Polychaeton citri CBS 116435 TaxID=1314669 RepID=A0A9P4USD1_9PEZI|nr:hypothetical protein K431DRAFT_15987 [Polychaeton citri CBS 116435]